MIIKSMSRKNKTFSQLFSYMKKGSSRNSEYDFFSKNLYSTVDKEIVREFSKNSNHLRARANGNYLFHEIISITKSKQLTLEQEKERLFEIVRFYTQRRCERNLVTGFLHDEKDNNVHYHLMISSNEIEENKNQRLTKFDFAKIKKETEKYVIEKHPELEQAIIINAKKEKRKARQSNKAWELKRKGGRQGKKDWMFTTLKDIFSNSKSKDDFFNHLANKNIAMYSRGKTIGFTNLKDSKKYRLKTLGLEHMFNQIQSLLKGTNKDSKKTKPSNKTQTNTVKSKSAEPEKTYKKTQQDQQTNQTKETAKGFDKEAEILKRKKIVKENTPKKTGKDKGQDFSR